jgi:hypothetical protein
MLYSGIIKNNNNMKPKGHFTNHELKIMDQFPLIGAHQVASNMLEAILICKAGIKDNNQLLSTLLNLEMDLTNLDIIEENLSHISRLSDHIAFCESTLYEAKAALNKLSHYLN